MSRDLELRSEYENFLRFCIFRLIRAIPVLIGVTFLVFLIFTILPSGSTLDILKLLEQYIGFLQQVIFEQDLGDSSIYNVPVTDIIGMALPATLELVIVSLILGIIIGVPLGIFSAYYYHTKYDYLATMLSYIGISMPTFWFGHILQSLFSLNLEWFDAADRISTTLKLELIERTHFYLVDSLLMGITENRWEFLPSVINHLIVPSLTLGLVVQGVITRTVRSLSLLEFQKDYIRTARSKGLKERLVIANHVTKNSLIPTVTIIGLLFGTLTIGSVLVEKVFSWNGLGMLTVDGVFANDYSLVQGCTLVVTILFIIINIITDISYAYIDPRIRYFQEV
jgi:peptide/nickel transport system permease protein